MQGRNAVFLALSGLERIYDFSDAMLTDNHIELTPDLLRAANISPATLLATDFLNHYNEIAMLIDLLAMDPEVAEDILDWVPMTYVEHFSASGFRDRDLAIQAFHQADPALIKAFEAACAAADEKILTVQAHLKAGETEAAIPFGKALYTDISTINGLIIGDPSQIEASTDGHSDEGCSQSDIDSLFA